MLQMKISMNLDMAQVIRRRVSTHQALPGLNRKWIQNFSVSVKHSAKKGF